MREIKFRVWHVIEWDEDDKPTKYQMTYDWAFEEYGTLNDQLSSVPGIMQYTGLKDKNGREIYEGDVVSYKQVERFGESVNTYTTTVKYEDYGFVPMRYNVVCEDDFYSCHIEEIEVIGNIHENPELL